MKGVQHSEDLARILAIPRRTLDFDSTETLELVDLLTKHFKTKWGTQVLRPAQALALVELERYKGCIAPIAVGGGKTLITLLAGEAIKAKRPLLVMPASLIPSKEKEVLDYLRHWRFTPPEMISYDKLGRTNYKTWLFDYAPDLIMLDEAHRVKNKTASVSRRLKRYMKANPDTVVISLSGTLFERKLEEVAHLCDYSLGDNSPLPVHYEALCEWGSALDEKVSLGTRLHAGALVKLCEESELKHFHAQPRQMARKGFGRRLRETPGVIVTGEEEKHAWDLKIQTHIIQVSPLTSKYFEKLRTDWETPDDHPFEFAPQLWAHARQLATGFYLRWNPRPPQAWINRRKDWSNLIRDTLHGRTYDSEKDVADAIDAGEISDPHDALGKWREMKPTFVPNSEVVWHDDTALDFVAKWSETNRGIIWVEHRGFGLRVAKRLKIRYFNQGGADDYGSIEDTRDTKEGCIVASIASNHFGRNLQHGWSNNLITSPPTTGAIWEQLIGRTDRYGQKSNCVSVDVMLGCSEHFNGFFGSIEQARHAHDQTLGSRKLLRATITQDFTVPHGAAWE